MLAFILRRGLAHGRRTWNRLTGYSARALAAVETRATLLSLAHGDDAPLTLGARVAVFCHFDGKGRIRDHTRLYLDALRAEGLDVVFVSNSGRLAPPDLAWLRQRAARIVLRRNVGYDFAAWRDALAACGLPAADTRFLLLANDSVYGPMRPLGPVLAAIDFDRADAWGATDSWQRRFHLQSYFVAFGPRALSSAAWRDFWSSVRNVRSKSWVVGHYEVGLTRRLLEVGLRCRAIWPYTETIAALRARRASQDGAPQDGAAEAADRDPFAEAAALNHTRIINAALRHAPVNPTADLWQVLIERGFPFLKRELLRENPSRVPGIAAWPAVIGGIKTFDADVIIRDLERVARNRSP